jgi:hypothetical protein
MNPTVDPSSTNTTASSSQQRVCNGAKYPPHYLCPTWNIYIHPRIAECKHVRHPLVVGTKEYLPLAYKHTAHKTGNVLHINIASFTNVYAGVSSNQAKRSMSDLIDKIQIDLNIGNGEGMAYIAQQTEQAEKNNNLAHTRRTF